MWNQVAHGFLSTYTIPTYVYRYWQDPMHSHVYIISYIRATRDIRFHGPKISKYVYTFMQKINSKWALQIPIKKQNKNKN